jgi:hypothetical protein
MRFAVITAVWLVVGLAIGASGILEGVRPPAPQIILASLTVVLLLAWRLNSSFRDWIRTVDLRVLIAVHVTRFVGFYFLFLCERGELPCTFAIPAAWGDILVATGATLILMCWNSVTRRPWTTAWNVVGFVDILFVVVSAGRHGMASPVSMAAMLRLPLSLLLTFLVPMIIASHIFIFSRLWSTEEKASR